MPVLILRAESSDRGAFADVAKSDLGGEYNVITINYPACESIAEPDDREYVVSELADAALQVIETFDIDYAAVVGYSFGCSIAVELARNFHGAIAIGLCRAPWPQSADAASSTSPPQKRYRLGDTKEEFGFFLKRADELYKQKLADPVVWYGG